MSRWGTKTSNKTKPDSSVCFWTFDSGVKSVVKYSGRACETSPPQVTYRGNRMENATIPLWVSELIIHQENSEEDTLLGRFWDLDRRSKAMLLTLEAYI